MSVIGLPAAVLILATASAIARPAAPATAAAPSFIDDRCGVAFQYPGDVSIQRVQKPAIPAADDRKPDCSFGITWPAWQQHRRESPFNEPEFPITIDVFSAPFDAVAEVSGFRDMDAERRAEGADLHGLPSREVTWTVSSRGANRPATPFARGPRFGVRGSGWSRSWVEGPCDPEKTGCIGSVNYEIAVVCDARRCASIFSSLDEDARDIVDCLLETFTTTGDSRP